MSIRTTPPGALVTLFEGGSFCLSDPVGDMPGSGAGSAAGLYVAGRRLLSRLVTTVNGQPLEPVDHHRDDPAAATFVARARRWDDAAPSAGGPVVVRRRTLGAAMRDSIEVRNLGDEPKIGRAHV